MKKELIILSGFLGSGKTTLLQSLIVRNLGRKMVILLNDFGQSPVDGTILSRAHIKEEIIEIAGGSVFCSCLTDTLVKTMFALAEKDIDLVILEASGMSDPSNISSMLKLSGLDDVFDHTTTLCTFDPVKSLKLSHVLTVIPRQLASANVAVLTKADMYTGDELAKAYAYIHTLEPDLPIARSYHGEMDLPNIYGRKDISSFTFGLNRPDNRPDSLELHTIKTTIKALIDSLTMDCILRVKGFIHTMDGIWFVSDTGTSIEYIPSQSAPVPLTIICLSGTKHIIQDKLKQDAII